MDNDFSLDQECTIAAVKSITDSQYGKKVQFTLIGYPNEVSTFTKFPNNMVAGGKIFGHVEVKDGKWHNFKFGKKASAPTVIPNTESRAGNLIDFKVLPMLEAIHGRLGLLMKAQGIKVDEKDYPPMTEANNADGFDDIPAF